MAEAVVSAVVQTLGDLIVVDEEADLLVVELKNLQRFLKVADEKQADSEVVRGWVSDTRRLAYQAEDLLERYAFKIQSPAGELGIFMRCIHFLVEVVTRHQVVSEIKTLKAKISNLIKSFKDYNIQEIMEKDGSSSSSSRLQLRRSYSRVVEEDLVGLESQVETLVSKLVGENYRVVSIWGMGGLGKTTLAKQVYHHPSVTHHFKALCWVCVSQQWNNRDLLEQILIKFIPEKREWIKNGRDEELVRQLFEFQQSTKCFVVLDDIWHLEAWESIKVAFPIREDGSKVLFTTRKEGIADANGFIYQPSLLNKDESWELLKKKSRIEKRHQEIDEEFQRKESLGKQMIKHCQGLPLGILLLGGILSRKQNYVEWEQVHNNIRSYLGKEDKFTTNPIRIEDIFSLSYNDLPNQLKPCFLYLSKYKEDADIEVESLYQIWMAEGLIFKEDQMKDETMMEVAERYLEELAKRCMVSVEVEKDEPQLLRFKCCRLHDIMREQCLVKAEKENFIELIEFVGKNSSVPLAITSPRVDIVFLPHRKEMIFKVEVNSETNWNQVEEAIKSIGGHENLTVDRTSGKITVVATYHPLEVRRRLDMIGIRASSEIVRHLEVDEQLIQHVFSQKEAIRNLRSFITSRSIDRTSRSPFYGTNLPLKSRFESLLHDFCVLRVLSIEGLAFSDTNDGLKLPSAIGKLIHLRYLSFRDSKLHNIPSSIGNLEQLQTLDLRCFILGRSKPKKGLLRRLKRLRHLYLGDYKLSVDGLVSLEILEGFDNEGVDDVGVISSLKNLVSLTATISEKVEDVEAFVNHVNDLFNIGCGRLRFLSLWIEDCESNRDEQAGSHVLKRLFLCNPLKVLTVWESKIRRLPEYEYHMAPNLHTLVLMDTRMEEDPMRTLEKLPNLRRLVLHYNSYEGEEMTCHADGFPQLKELEVNGLPHFNKWRIEEGAMPNLSVMIFHSCKKMKMVPDGFRYLRSLQELRISSMTEEFKSRVQIDHQGGQGEGGEDLHKISHVPSVIIR